MLYYYYKLEKEKINVEPKLENDILTFNKLSVEHGKLKDVTEVHLPYSQVKMLSKDVLNIDSKSVQGTSYLVDIKDNRYLISEKTYNFVYNLFKKV